MKAILWTEVQERDRWQKDVCIACGGYARPGEPAFFIEWDHDGPGPWICDTCVFEGRSARGEEVEVREVHLAWMAGYSEGYKGGLSKDPPEDLF